MIEYVIVLILLVMCNVVKISKKKQEKIAGIFFIIFILLSAMRKYTVGADTRQFWDIFRYIGLNYNNAFTVRTEKGFNILCLILLHITKNPQILLIITSLFVNIIIYRFICKNSNNILLSTLMYFTLNYYFAFICLMRQGIAIALVLIGYEFLKDNKFLRFGIFVILASLFHSSALVMLLLIILKKYNKNNNLIIFTLIGSLLGFVLAPALLNIAIKFGDLAKYVDSKYIASSYVSAGLYTLTNFAFLLFGTLVPDNKKLKKYYKKDNIHMINSWIIAIASIVSAVSIKISIFNRLFLYFNFFNIIWVPNSLELVENKNNKIIFKYIIILCTIIYVCAITKMGWYGVVPYEFFFE